MPGPTILRPVISTSPMESLTFLQQHALHSVRVGDIILVEPESSASHPYLILVDTITSSSRDSIRISTKATYSINRTNLFDCQRYGTWNLQCMASHWPNGWTLEELLSPGDVLMLNPTIAMLRIRFMGVICLYQNCTLGLVRKSPITVNDVHFQEAESRAGRVVWTLCPYCMGHEIQQRHECLVTCTTPERYSNIVLQAHLQAINLKRAENGYPPLSPDIDLVVLDGQQEEAQATGGGESRPPSPALSYSSPSRRTIRRHPVPSPEQSRHSSRGTYHWSEGPRLSLHSFKWFQNARERVLNDVCGLCQEDYQEGERIVDLLCQHFYHEDCLKVCFEVQREERRREACPLCRRRVIS